MKEPKKQLHKPSGPIGPIEINTTDGNAEFQALDFPTRKAELELYIVNFVVNGLRNTGTNFYSLVSDPVQNPEKDFDFTLSTNNGKENLELMEVAPLDLFGGSYEAAPASYNHGEMADDIYSKIIKKALGYGVLQIPVHLLIYTTDWRFRLASGVLTLLRYWLWNRNEHSFKTILYFLPDDATHGKAEMVYPVDTESWAKFDEQAFRNRRTFLGNLSKLNIKPEGSIDIPLGKAGEL